MNVSQFLLGSIPLLIQLYADFYRETDFQSTLLELESEYNVPKIKTYDFIIVGGGSAGSVLAGRLSEFFNVLLLEAGGNPPPAVAVPYFSSSVSQAPSINYFYRSVPNTNAALSNNGISSSATGRMLGGTGSHNVVTHNRGSPMDFDNWAFLLNDDSFNYTNVLKYFKRMETFIGQKIGTAGDEYYGHDGPIIVDTRNHPIQDLFFKAGRELGYAIDDPNAYQREGFSPRNVAIRKGHRSSSYVEYVKPYESLRSTLTVIRYANVSEILLDDEKKAYGVAYTRHGLPQIAHATKKIVLSAGTFSTPLLLMKSGIGPENILNAAEIPVKVPLEAVGKNYRDHVILSVSGFSVNDTSSFLKINPSDTEKISEEFHNGEGVLAMTSTGPIAFIASSKAKLGWPDLQIEIGAFATGDGEQQRVSFVNFLRRPQSIGLVSLDTEKYKAGIRDNVQLAILDQKLLTHPDDIEALVDGVKLIFKIAETEAFKSINFTYAAAPDSACRAFTFLTDDYWRCRAQQSASSSSHPVGTCSMGPDTANSTTSVVDTKFSVRGVSNLMVVDASVMPEITNTNINAAIMMLAEKASEYIINYYQVTTTRNTDTSSIDIVSTIPNGSTSILADTKKFFLVSVFFLFLSQYLYI